MTDSIKKKAGKANASAAHPPKGRVLRPEEMTEKQREFVHRASAILAYMWRPHLDRSKKPHSANPSRYPKAGRRLERYSADATVLIQLRMLFPGGTRQDTGWPPA